MTERATKTLNLIGNAVLTKPGKTAAQRHKHIQPSVMTEDFRRRERKNGNVIITENKAVSEAIHSTSQYNEQFQILDSYDHQIQTEHARG